VVEIFLAQLQDCAWGEIFLAFSKIWLRNLIALKIMLYHCTVVPGV